VPPREPPIMGNGASGKQILVDGETLDIVRLQQLLPQLQHQLKQSQLQLEEKAKLLRVTNNELEETKKVLREKDREMVRLRAEVDKLKSVLQATVHDGRPDILATVHEEAAMAGKVAHRNKKQGVSGESSQHTATGSNISIRHFDKDFRLVFIVQYSHQNIDLLFIRVNCRPRSLLYHKNPKEKNRKELRTIFFFRIMRVFPGTVHWF